MSPKVLCVGRFTPDCRLRWLSDGFALAGGRVLRAGATDYRDPVGYSPWPDEAKPRVHACPGFPECGLEAGDPEPAVLDLRAIVGHFAGGIPVSPPERGQTPATPVDLRSDAFTPDLVFVAGADAAAGRRRRRPAGSSAGLPCWTSRTPWRRGPAPGALCRRHRRLAPG